MKGLDSNSNPHEKIKNISKGNYVSTWKRQYKYILFIILFYVF